ARRCPPGSRAHRADRGTTAAAAAVRPRRRSRAARSGESPSARRRRAACCRGTRARSWWCRDRYRQCSGWTWRTRSGDFAFARCDDRTIAGRDRREIETLDDPAAMTQRAAERRLPLDVADDLHAPWIGARVDGHDVALVAAARRRHRHVLVEGTPAAVVH